MKEFSLHQLTPQIFWAEFEDQYTLCMTFFRYQEFYESDNPLLKDKVSSLLDSMEIYSKSTDKKCFSYASDWAGFNLPSHVIESVGPKIKDHNKYDYMMMSMHGIIRTKTDKPYYLIGTLRGETSFLNHELAHGFFYADEEYKKKMLNLVDSLSDDLYDKVLQILKMAGYCNEVLKDEAQAYLSTGPDKELDVFFTEKDREPFEKVFNEYVSTHVEGKDTIIW